MNKVKMKIHSWDDQSNSLIISFASDVSGKSPDEYEGLAYQPTVFDNTDKNYVLKQIARSGASICESQDKRDQFAANNQLKQQFIDLVGQEMEFSIEELFAPEEPTVLPIGSEPR